MIDIQDLKSLDDYINFKKAEGRPLTVKETKHFEIAQKAMDRARSKFNGCRANIISSSYSGVQDTMRSSSISNMRDFVDLLTIWFSKNNYLSSDKITYHSLV